MTITSVALAGVAAIALVSPAVAQQAQPVPAATLVTAVNLPYEEFTLPNGLRVVVHTDRKAPVVALSAWYDVGAKHEPAGKTGFAHLFEHLMFNGSENAPDDFFEPLKQVGATDFNGTTNLDRTNYYETVPTAALERALFLESDRMGYLLGAVTQGKLDEQRGVVQNEKRQGDNQPYGLVDYKITAGLLPVTHPYGHDTIGSMADLDAATLTTVRDWFRSHYGPNNAVLALAGDVDVPTAKRLVTKYFGAIPSGPKTAARVVPVTTLAAPKVETMKDRVAAVMISRSWTVPGSNDPQSVNLDIAANVLGGLASSRLQEALVRQEKLATSVSAYNYGYNQIGQFTIQVIVKEGVDPAKVMQRLDAITADFLKDGPTADEVSRVVTNEATGRIASLESVNGQARVLASGALLANDPGFAKKELERLAAATPASVKAAADRWLTRPSYTLTVVPGPRDAYEEAKVPPPAAVKPAPETPVKGTRGGLPALGTIGELKFPAVQRTKLSNGIELIYAQQAAVPMTQMSLSFDAGAAADVPGKSGTQQLTLSSMDEGTATLSAAQLAIAKERLGASINTGFGADRTYVTLGVPSANLSPATALFADIVRRPAFADAEVARVRDQQIAQIAQELTNPGGLSQRALPPLLYGKDSPYARTAGSGDARAVAGLTRADLIAFQQAWLRPDKAKLFVVSDRPLAEVQAALEPAFGDWKASGTAGVKRFEGAGTPAAPKIVLIDRPDSPQSVIVAGIPNALTGTEDLLPIQTANDALGGGFLGRLNMDLREGKHWSYGVYGIFRQLEHAAPFYVQAPVQADKTGPSIAALRSDLSGFVGAEPMTQVEFDRAISGAVRSLSGNFETGGAVLGAMQNNDLYRRPDDYYATIAQRYRGMTLPQLNTAMKAALDPSRAIWVVIGDAKVVRPQLDTLGLPVESVTAASVTGAKQEIK